MGFNNNLDKGSDNMFEKNRLIFKIKDKSIKIFVNTDKGNCELGYISDFSFQELGERDIGKQEIAETIPNLIINMDSQFGFRFDNIINILFSNYKETFNELPKIFIINNNDLANYLINAYQYIPIYKIDENSKGLYEKVSIVDYYKNNANIAFRGNNNIQDYIINKVHKKVTSINNNYDFGFLVLSLDKNIIEVSNNFDSLGIVKK